jgi:hypothetical protein
MIICLRRKKTKVIDTYPTMKKMRLRKTVSFQVRTESFTQTKIYSFHHSVVVARYSLKIKFDFLCDMIQRETKQWRDMIM